MTPLKMEIDRFDGKGDFALWRQRMRAILIQSKAVKALEDPPKFPDLWTTEKKEEAMDMAYSTLILHLADKVLREVANEKTAHAVWKKLESLYMTKTLTNRVFLKGKLFGFKMDEEKDLEENLDEFNKIIIDLANVDVKIEEEDQAIVILNSLPPSYQTFVDTMKYARQTLTLEEVMSALKSKQLQEKSQGGVADGLSVQKRFTKKLKRLIC